MFSLEEWDSSLRNIVTQCVEQTSLALMSRELTDFILSGKKIRSRLAFRLSESAPVSESELLYLAAAVEMIHSASLLHDDVIDRAQKRRGLTAFWVKKGISGAILLGDLLICQSIKLIFGKSNSENFEVLFDFINQVCNAEAEQELLSNKTQLTYERSICVARKKTGALFAFIAYACGTTNDELKDELKESGYDIGTAFQLADDLYDRYGDIESAGKSLRNDEVSQKITTAVYEDEDDHIEKIDALCVASLKRLEKWPDIHKCWESFIVLDFKPAIEEFICDYSVNTSKD
ncbi:MAG: polyprenyl synthetase family protein [Planctomycetota bacterium]|jgi:geranylgeranyl pyrophosphate synthase